MGPYRLLEPVGKGGQGSVWLARDRRNGGFVALKVLRDDLRGPKEAARFRREAAILSSLRDPGLPACLHLLEQPEGVPVALAMEFVKGAPLSQEIRQRRLSPVETRAMVCELARVVGVLHTSGLVHRDIKTANILLREGWRKGVPGSVVLVDLGIAKGTSRHATSHTEPGFVVGSAGCLAPELLLRPAEVQAASTRVDVFAFGVLLWVLLFDRHPTGLPMRTDVLDLLEAYADNVCDHPDPETLAPIERSVPGLVDVARRCAAYEPVHRYADAREVYDALSVLRASGGNTQIYVEPAAVSYNVAILPRPSPVDASGGQHAPPAYATLDLDEEAATRVRLCPPPDPTVDEPVSETIAELRLQFGESLDDEAPQEPCCSLPERAPWSQAAPADQPASGYPPSVPPTSAPAPAVQGPGSMRAPGNKGMVGLFALLAAVVLFSALALLAYSFHLAR